MKKFILLIFTTALLNGCAEYSSFLGPTITVAKTGNVARGISAKTLVNESSELRECKTIHSAELNKIFFDTLDELDCKRNDPTILR
jgi:hypothetical protein